MEVVPGIHQLKVPIPNNPLGFLNAYLIRGDDRCVLVDAGWNATDSFASFERQLTELGVKFTDISLIIVTHIHPDHYGLAGKIKEMSGAEVAIHQMETPFIESRYKDFGGLLAEMAAWLRINGVPDSDLERLQRASMDVLDFVYLSYPDRILTGGEIIEVGEFRFEVIWTPGHSPGHVCLYEPQKRILLAGDHVLPIITPNVSLNVQNIGNPLVDFIDALHAVSRLPVDIVLPAHEHIFHDLPKRVQEILHHHEVRMQEIMQTIGDGRLTAYDIAGIIPWETHGRDWKDLPAWEKRSAVTETLAHLELMHAENRVEKSNVRGVVHYGPCVRT